jgi:hypothetical protein
MELAIYRKKNHKTIALTMAVVCVLCLIPITFVIASALTDPTIGMNGVNNSQLTVGRTGVNGSDQLIDNGSHSTILNPSSGAGQLAVTTVIVFMAFSILLILYEIETKKKPIYLLLTIAILIYIALALLPNINSIVNNLLGG